MSSSLLDVDVLLREAAELRPLPASATRLAGLVSNGETDLAEIAEAIRFDEALTGRVLGAANSAMIGARIDVSDVDDAVVRLGTGRVLAIALGGVVGKDMMRALPEYGLGEGELWRHSVAAALAVERAPRFCKRSVQPEAFATALLHDIGKLVLARHLHMDHVQAIQEHQHRQDVDLDEAERSILSVSHAQLGAEVARFWKLPETIALGIEHHHAPLNGPDESSRALCSYIRLADAVAGNLGHSCGGKEPHPFTHVIAGGLGISQSGFDELCTDVERRLDDVLTAYAA